MPGAGHDLDEGGRGRSWAGLMISFCAVFFFLHPAPPPPPLLRSFPPSKPVRTSTSRLPTTDRKTLVLLIYLWTSAVADKLFPATAGLAISTAALLIRSSCFLLSPTLNHILPCTRSHDHEALFGHSSRFRCIARCCRPRSQGCRRARRSVPLQVRLSSAFHLWKCRLM